jgi:hypothetical protein
MAKIWGPLGWMTLHSISINYPQNPSAEDRAILEQFMGNFTESITCNNCKTHFQDMFVSYKRKYPQWSSSRREFFLFVCRAHNTVNKRIDKPVIASVAECINAIKNNTRNTSLRQFRKNYIVYLLNTWSRFHTFDGMNMTRVARELEKINNSYWDLRETDLSVFEMGEGDVTEFIKDTTTVQSIGLGFPSITRGTNVSVGFKFKGGRLRLGNH